MNSILDRNSTDDFSGTWCLESHRPLPVIHRDTWYRRLYLQVRSAATEPTGSLMIFFATIGLLAVAFATGCSDPRANTPVDASMARDALKTALESWKRGNDVKSLQASSTPMIVQDFDWMGGMSLIDYRIIDEGQSLDANLSVPVKLTLSGGKAKKKSLEKTVYYLVGTSPKTTVFRDMFR
jgi:hypothetical protein